MRPKQVQKLRMQDASKRLYVHGSTVYTNNRIAFYALEIAHINPLITNKRTLKRLLIKDIRKRYAKEKHTFSAIGWAWLIWWIIPKVIEWFLIWFMEDQKAETIRLAELQRAINEALGEMG